MPQAYPTRPVRIIVGFPAGGTTDIMARLMGQWLSGRLGQQFVIENRPGAAGNIAAEAVVKAAPTSRHQFDRSGMTFFGSDAKNNTIQTQRRTTSLYKNSPVRFHAIGSVDMLHLTTPGVEKKNDHVIANVPIPINEPSADRIGIKDRKSTRLNSSHLGIPYAVFYLKKKKSEGMGLLRRRYQSPFLHAAFLNRVHRFLSGSETPHRRLDRPQTPNGYSPSTRAR